jgi:ABC-type transport system substrate-binding protein
LDFPVVPAGSTEKGRLPQAKNGHSFTKQSTPPGTGPYQLQSKGGEFFLSWNEKKGPAPAIKTIRFYGVNSSSTLMHGLEMGNYQFAYTNLNSSRAERVSAQMARVPTTNLLYLTFNRGRGALSGAALRVALGACINPQKALSESFSGYAQAVNTPFPPKWHGVKAADFAKTYDPAIARKNLEALGYIEQKDGVRASKFRKLSFVLLISKGSAPKAALAKAIQSQLKAFQIEIQIQALPQADYAAAAKAGRFDLCLGELRLTPDCNLSPLLISGGAATGGIDVWGKASNAYGQMLQDLQTPAEFVYVFQQELPFLPLGYRSGMAAFAQNLHISGELQRNNLFRTIASWAF